MFLAAGVCCKHYQFEGLQNNDEKYQFDATIMTYYHK